MRRMDSKFPPGMPPKVSGNHCIVFPLFYFFFFSIVVEDEYYDFRMIIYQGN